MNTGKIKKLISGFLCLIALVSLLSGCKKDEEPEDTAVSDSVQIQEDDTDEVEFDTEFTLNCTGEGMYNPFKVTSAYDKDVSTLIYDCLYVLDDGFVPTSDIVDGYTTSDGTSYTFNIAQGMTLHDGSLLDGVDVAYSINMARSSSQYSRRLSDIESCIATDDYVVEITLYKANMRLTSILDVPIVGNGTGEDSNPVGSGPYMLSGDKSCLVPFENYRNKEFSHLDKISLSSYDDDGIGIAFISHDIDMVHFPAVKADELNVRSLCERSAYDTSIIQYIGFNMTNTVTSDAVFRRAVSHLIDRETIADDIMNEGAVASSLILNPKISYYDTEWEKDRGYDTGKASELLKKAGMKDTDSDGYLEFINEEEVYTSFKLDFIVNEEDTSKVRSAQLIASALQEAGVNVELNILPWSEFKYSLEQGSYDMYYTEARLSADFDISPFIEENGTLNYSGIENESLLQYNSYYMASTGDNTAKYAKNLCTAFYSQSPVVPIVYEKGTVMTHWGSITDINYSQSGVFSGISGATITVK